MRPLLTVVMLPLTAGAAAAEQSPPAPVSRTRLPAPTAEQEYKRGLAATRAKEWSVAGAAFSRAVELKPGYAEAWDGLGYALRNQGRYPESLKAYDEVRLDDARRVLDLLRPLDAGRARQLAEVIQKGK